MSRIVFCNNGLITRPGFREKLDGVCYQIDECKTGENLCEYEDLCEDIAGSYKCLCPLGQKLSDNLHNCSMIECGLPQFVLPCDSENCSQVQTSCSDSNYYLNRSVNCFSLRWHLIY